MIILAINCGSSSLKADLLKMPDGASSQRPHRLLSVQAERIHGKQARLKVQENSLPDARIPPEEPLNSHDTASGIEQALKRLLELTEHVALDAVVHRVVHGGLEFQTPCFVDDTTVEAIEALAPLAPLHNPLNALGIRAARNYFPNVPHIAVFDTAFHRTLPHRATVYALPRTLNEKHEIRRYGFHGTSHEYVAQLAASYLKAEPRALRLITCHLGNGCSITAIEYGSSVETSMGYTPTEGLVMGSRSGDLDPGIITKLLREESYTPEALDQLLNTKSGLKGLCGQSDMREILSAAAAGDEPSRLALNVFCHRAKKYIGAYAAVMGGVDAIIFTGGIGENSPVVRHRIAQRLDFLGAVLDEDRNRNLSISRQDPVAEFSAPISRVKLLAVATDEQSAMAEQAQRLIEQTSPQIDARREDQRIPIAVSARHVHLQQETVEALFGPAHTLQERNPLSQPGQFAAEETVSLIGPRNTISSVRVLGPTRSIDQVEISRTDEYYLGIDAPVRESGNTENSPGIILQGPYGSVNLHTGVICAWRHIHMTPDDARRLGVKHGDIVEVRIEGVRGLTFSNVLVRVSPHYRLELHVDTDEANAAQVETGMHCVITRTL